MNRRLKVRLILYPIVIIAFFAYSALHQKSTTSNGSSDAIISKPSISANHANPHAKPSFLLKTMANIGLTQSQVALIKFYVDNDEFANAKPLADKIYASHNGVAINNVGTFYNYKKHYATALKFYEKASDTYKRPLAQANLGALYMSGQGVTKDAAKAKQLFQASADSGNALGQYNLGILYAYESNVAQAKRYLNLALSNKDPLEKHDAEQALAKIKEFEQEEKVKILANNK
jgi:tetratricopeptide (TPR) repeat protein